MLLTQNSYAQCTGPTNDCDNDGVVNSLDLDDDNDGILDSVELRCDQPTEANPNSGTGSLQDQLYLFNWTDPAFADGLDVNDTQTFNLPSGLQIVATVTSVTVNNPPPPASGLPYALSDLMTWNQAAFAQAYNTPGDKEAFYLADGTDIDITMTFVGTKNGIPFPLDLLAFDAESTGDTPGTPNDEQIIFTTNGENWEFVETIHLGDNTTPTNNGIYTVSGQTLIADETFDTGSSLYVSNNASEIRIQINHLQGGGREAFAYGIYLRCDTDGDSIPNSIDTDSDGDGCSDALEGEDAILVSAVDANGMLTGTVNASTNGVPNNVNATNGQGVGSSLNAVLFDADGQCDQDGDGVLDANDVCFGFDDKVDADGDTVPDGCDVDDDNDGILDLNECTSMTANWGTAPWVLNGNLTQTFTDVLGPVDMTIQTSTSAAGSYGANNMNLDPASGGLTGNTNDVAISFDPNASTGKSLINISVTFSEPVYNLSFLITDIDADAVNNPAQKKDRVTILASSGLVNITTINPSNSGVTVISNQVTPTNFNFESSNDNKGSVLVSVPDGATTVTMLYEDSSNFNNTLLREIGILGDLTFCRKDPNADADNDGLPNSLDTDSDNDGCPDAIEANGTITQSRLTSFAGGSNGGSLLNLGMQSDTNGSPLLNPTDTNGFTQLTTLAVVDQSNTSACYADLSLIKTVSNAIVKVDDTIVYTLTVKNEGPNDAFNINVKDVLPTGLTYLNDNATTTSTTFTDSDANTEKDLWSISALNANQTINLQITVQVKGTGEIKNISQITQSNKTDPDSTPGNGVN